MRAESPRPVLWPGPEVAPGDRPRPVIRGRLTDAVALGQGDYGFGAVVRAVVRAAVGWWWYRGRIVSVPAAAADAAAQ